MPISITLPVPAEKKLAALNLLVEQNPEYIPLTKVAAFLGADAEGLRCCIERGQCPFGIGWQKDIQHGKSLLPGNRAFKIPSVTFYLWYTQGVGYKS